MKPEKIEWHERERNFLANFPDRMEFMAYDDVAKLATERVRTLTPNEYQAKAAETCLENSDNYPYLVMGLASEAGEVADKFKKAIRDGIPDTEKHKEGVAKELGDVLWYVAIIARLMGVSLEDVMKKNVEKLALRKKRDCLHGSGDDREHAATPEDIARYTKGSEEGCYVRARRIDEADDGS